MFCLNEFHWFSLFILFFHLFTVYFRLDLHWSAFQHGLHLHLLLHLYLLLLLLLLLHLRSSVLHTRRVQRWGVISL
jgi:hypothetical protein